jgi:hypothetical protein
MNLSRFTVGIEVDRSDRSTEGEEIVEMGLCRGGGKSRNLDNVRRRGYITVIARKLT